MPGQINFKSGQVNFTLDTYSIFRHGLFCMCSVFQGLPCVVTLAPNSMDQTYDGVKYGDALQQLEQMGADVVGLNCFRGPDSMLPIIKEVRAKCKVSFDLSS